MTNRGRHESVAKTSPKWHSRHVSIDTPCRLLELEGIANAIGNQGWWNTAIVSVRGNSIVIEFGDGPENTK